METVSAVQAVPYPPQRGFLGQFSEQPREMLRAMSSVELTRERPPNTLSDLLAFEAVIEDSRWILALDDNWDEEGAGTYDVRTWEEATSLLRTYALAARSRHKTIPVPVIGPGPDGSIDLHWTSGKFVLLLNVRKAGDPAGPAGFYGRNDELGIEIKGTFNPKKLNWGVLDWLTSNN